jgi:hypothetical protein
MKKLIRLSTILGPPMATIVLVMIWADYPELLIRDTTDDLGLRRILFPALVTFTTTVSILAITSLGSLHKAFKPTIQVAGLGAMALGGIIIGYLLNISCEMAISMVAHGIASFSAAAIAVGATIGLLLAMVTGRPHPPDPLLELESTSAVAEEE